MVHSALKRKRYSGEFTESGTESSPNTTIDFSDYSELVLVSPSLLFTPPRPPNPVAHPMPPAPSSDPRPSLKILLELMTPAEFTNVLKARIDTLLQNWPPIPQPHTTGSLPSPASSSSPSSSPCKPQEARNPNLSSIRAFVAFFWLENFRAPFSYAIHDLYAHLRALQILLSFLTPRELKEIVKLRLNAEGDAQERWTVVQGVLDVMRNAGTEDDGDADVEMDAGGMGPRFHEGGISSGATDISNNDTFAGSAASSLGKYSAIDAEKEETCAAPPTPQNESPSCAVRGADRLSPSHEEPPEASTLALSSDVGPVISPPSLHATTGVDVVPGNIVGNTSPTASPAPAVLEKATTCDQANSAVPAVPAAIDSPAAPSPVSAQDADTDVDMDMSDDGDADCSLLVTTVRIQNEGSSDDHIKTSEADKAQKPVPVEESHEKLVRQAEDASKDLDKSDLSRHEGARYGPVPRLTITLPPMSRKSFGSAAPLPSAELHSSSSDEPASKRRRINRASKYTPLPTPASPTLDDLVSPRLPPPAPETRTLPRLSPPAVSLIRPAPRFVPARFTSSHIIPAITANPTVEPPAPAEPPASKIKPSQALRSEEIVAIKQEIGESLNAEQERKEKEFVKESRYNGQGSASSPILISDTPTFSAPNPPASPLVSRPVVPSAPRAIASIAAGTRSIFVAPTGDPIDQSPPPANSPRTLRPEGPEPPPPFEAKPVTPPTKVEVSEEKVKTFVKRSSYPVQRGRTRSRSESSRSGRSGSDSRSTSRRRSGRQGNQGIRHRLPRRPISPSPTRRRRASAAYSSSRSRSRRRSRSGSRTGRYRSRRSISPRGSPSRSRSPANLRRKYSYSRPPSPTSARRESPVRSALNDRHWSPGDARKHRDRRFDKRSRSPTPSRMFDHWSPRNGQSRRANGPNRGRKDAGAKGFEKTNALGGDILARPMNPTKSR